MPLSLSAELHTPVISLCCCHMLLQHQRVPFSGSSSSTTAHSNLEKHAVTQCRVHKLTQTRATPEHKENSSVDADAGADFCRCGLICRTSDLSASHTHSLHVSGLGVSRRGATAFAVTAALAGRCTVVAEVCTPWLSAVTTGHKEPQQQQSRTQIRASRQRVDSATCGCCGFWAGLCQMGKDSPWPQLCV